MNPSPSPLLPSSDSDRISRQEVKGFLDVGRYLASVREVLVAKCNTLFARIQPPEVTQDQLRNALFALSLFIPAEQGGLRDCLMPPDDLDMDQGSLSFDLANRTYRYGGQTLPLAHLFRLDEVPMTELQVFREKIEYPLGHQGMFNEVGDVIKDPNTRKLVEILYEELCLSIDDYVGRAREMTHTDSGLELLEKESEIPQQTSPNPPLERIQREQSRLENCSFLTRLQAIQFLDDHGGSRIEPLDLRFGFSRHLDDIINGKRGPKQFLSHFPRVESEKEQSILKVLQETVDVDPMLWMNTPAWILGRSAQFHPRHFLYEVLTDFPLAVIFSERGIAPEAQHKHFDDLLQLVSYAHVPIIPHLAAKSALCWEQYQVAPPFSWRSVAERRPAVSFDDQPATQEDHLTYLYLKLRGLLGNPDVQSLPDLMRRLLPEESGSMTIRKNSRTKALLSDRWAVMNKVFRAAFDADDQGLEMQLMSIFFHRLSIWSEKEWTDDEELFQQLKALSYHLQQGVDPMEVAAAEVFQTGYESRFHVVASTTVKTLREDFAQDKKLLTQLSNLLNGMRIAQREVRTVITRLLVGIYPGLYGKISEGRFLIDIAELCPDLLWSFSKNHLVMPFLINGGISAFILPMDEEEE